MTDDGQARVPQLLPAEGLRGGIFVLDPDQGFPLQLAAQCAQHGLKAEWFPTVRPFLEALDRQRPHCIILEVELDDRSGLDIQAHLARLGYRIPLIFAARRAEPTAIVRAIKGGAQDFLVKPVVMDTLCKQVHAALESTRTAQDCEQRRERLRQRMLTLTQREQDVLALALTGKANKEISRLLAISPRTVESHRSHVMDKLGLNNLLELAHILADEGRKPSGPVAKDGGDLQ